MTGHLNVNVTRAKELISELKRRNIRISFTGWIADCISKSVQQFPMINSFRKGRRELVQFNDIDIIVMIERQVEDQFIPVPYSIRRSNSKNVVDISKEIWEARQKPMTEKNQLLYEGKLLWMYDYLPKFLRQKIIRRFTMNPMTIKKQGGLIVLTSINRFTKSKGWISGFGGLTTLNIVIGGSSTELVKFGGDYKQQEFIQLTLSLDHDILDGAPAARFSAYFVDLLESASNLQDLSEFE